MPPFNAIEMMTQSAVVAASIAMLKIAHTDGVHQAEVDLIRSFYTGCANGADWPSFDNILQQSSKDVQIDAAAFNSGEEREGTVALCMMTAYADGSFSDAEAAAVRAIAGALGVTQDRLDAILALVKDDMLAHLSHLPDAGSVAQVAKELG